MQHKIAIFVYATKYFWILLIPVIRLVLHFGPGAVGAFDGVYVDITAISVLFLYGFLKWRFTEFYVKKHEIILKSGIFLKAAAVLEKKEITSVVLERTLVLRFFSATRVRICTNSSDRALVLYCKKEQLAQFYPRERLSSPRGARWYSVLFYSLLNSSSLSGALIISASVSQLGRILGVRLDEKVIDEIEGFGNRLQLGMPPLFVTLGLFIIISWAASFLKNTLDAGRFSIKKRGDIIVVASGTFSLYTSFLTEDKVNSLDIRRNMLSVVTKSGTPYIHCTGYGSGKNEMSVAFPSCRDKKAAEIISCFFSRFTPYAPEVRPPKRGFFGYLAVPLGWGTFFALAFAAAVIFTNLVFVSYLCAVGLLVFLWLLVVRIAAFSHSGISEGERTVCIRNVRFFSLHTVSLRKSRIAYCEISQNPFQRLSGLCDVIVYELRGNGKRRHKVRNLDHNAVKMLSFTNLHSNIHK